MKERVIKNREELQNMVETFAIAYDMVCVVDEDGRELMRMSEIGAEETEPGMEGAPAGLDSVLSIPVILRDQGQEQQVTLELYNKASEELQLLNRRIYEDSLTGVFNRRYYDEQRYILDMPHALPKHVGFVVIDINRFKYVNDHFGHVCGDELLAAVADVLQKNIRQSDCLMRIGGDEFLLILRDCSKLFSAKKILQLKGAVAEIRKPWMGDYTPSMSAGMAYSDAFDGSKSSMDALVREADKKMFEDKSMPPMKKKSMLIVDDLEVNRDVLKYYFCRDFEVFEAADGVEALELLRSRIFEIVITDIYMPRMDGLTLTREIRKDPEIANTIVFVITERGEKHELGSLEAGADDFINKPFNPELLSHRMKGVLSQNTVFNRISQYQLSFNQNQIAFATVRLEQDDIVFQYVNDAFAQLMDGTPQDFVSGRRTLHFKGFERFLQDVSKTCQRKTMTVHDEPRDNYYDIVAYAQENGFCSFIMLRNEAMKLVRMNEERYHDEFEQLARINPDTLGALFINLQTGICEKAFGRSPYLNHFQYPISYEEVQDSLSEYTLNQVDRKKFLEITGVEYLMKCYQSGTHNLRAEFPFRLASGATHWLGVYTKLLTNPNNGEPHAILYCIDIHNLKMSQLVIDAISKQNFDTLFCIDVGAGSAQIYQGDGEIFWSQPFSISQMDASIADYLERHYPEPDKEQFIRENTIPAIAAKMKDIDTYTVNYPLIDDEGHWTLKRGTYSWLDGDRKLMCFTREDITEIVRKEQESKKKLEQINQELVHASNAKLEFLSRMSHDIRTPMNTILGLTALAVDEVHHPEKMMEYIRNINDSGKFLLGLVNDILDMDKINRGEMKLHREPYPYNELIATMKLMFTNPCKQKGIRIHFQPAAVNKTVMTDKIRLNQIFFNVLSNAVKYTPEGGDIYYETENLLFDENAGCICCDYVIRDTGIGMSEEFQKHMFQEFAQEGKDAAVTSMGSGLGLAITKSLLDLMGGTIQIESEEGKGTTVRIHLRFELQSEAEATQAAEVSARELPEEHHSLEGVTVLLAEDHPLNQAIAKKLLEKQGMLVHCADNGKDALTQFADSDPGYFQVVLMDIRMPVMDGLEAARQIRALDRPDAARVPILAMTANAYGEDIAMTRAAGMNEHLSKPIDPERLYGEIRKCLELQDCISC